MRVKQVKRVGPAHKQGGENWHEKEKACSCLKRKQKDVLNKHYKDHYILNHEKLV